MKMKNFTALLLAGIMVLAPCMSAGAASWDDDDWDDDDWDEEWDDDTPFWEKLDDWEIEAAAISGPGLQSVDNPNSYMSGYNYSYSASDYSYPSSGWGWQLLSNGDWVYWENGTLALDGWRLVDNVWYYFDPNGIMKLGITPDGTITDGSADTYAGPSNGFAGETVYLDGVAQANKTTDTSEQKQTNFYYEYSDRNTHSYGYDDLDHSVWWYGDDDDDDDWDDDDDDWDDDDDDWDDDDD